MINFLDYLRKQGSINDKELNLFNQHFGIIG